jgi:hypothetical protein
MRNPLPLRKADKINVMPMRGKKNHVSLGIAEVTNGLRKKAMKLCVGQPFP